MKHNRQVAQYLFRHSVHVVRQSALPYFICTEKEQRGNSFGERLFHAVEDVFANGYRKVIVIGNDSLSLNTADLVKAAKGLEACSFVIAPTSKGGVSLLGISREDFDKDTFLSISWQTEKVAGELLQFANNRQFAIAVHAERNDINGYEDLNGLLRETSKLDIFYKTAVSLLASLAVVLQIVKTATFCSRSKSNFGLRAPPCC